MIKRLTDFINKYRDRFEVKHNNMFAFSFSEVLRYLKFLEVIALRHQNITSSYTKTVRKFQETLDKRPGSHVYTDEQTRLDAKLTSIALLVQLEVESFYLFAKILLDKITRAIEFYFGQSRNLSLDSHDDFVRIIEKYSNDKGLSIKVELVLFAKKLKEDISDLRDNQVAHLKSPRTVRGTTADGRMLLNQIYPKENDQQKGTKLLTDLATEIDQYIELVIEFIESNFDKTNLTKKLQKILYD